MAKLEFTQLRQIENKNPVQFNSNLITIEDTSISTYRPFVISGFEFDDVTEISLISSEALLVQGSYSTIKAFIENTPQP